MNGLTKIEELEETISHLQVDLVHAHQQSAELLVRIKELEAACAAMRAHVLNDTVMPPDISFNENDYKAWKERRKSVLRFTNPGQPLLDRLHALELAQTACLGERDTAIGRVKDLESGLEEAVKVLDYSWQHGHEDECTRTPVALGPQISTCLMCATIDTALQHLKPLISEVKS